MENELGGLVEKIIEIYRLTDFKRTFCKSDFYSKRIKYKSSLEDLKLADLAKTGNLPQELSEFYDFNFNQINALANALESALEKKHRDQNQEDFQEAKRNAIAAANPELFTTIDYDNLVIATDIISAEQVLIDRKTHKVSEVSFDAFRKSLSAKYLNMAIEEGIQCELVYNPYDLSEKFLRGMEQSNKKLLCINRYIAPSHIVELDNVNHFLENPEEYSSEDAAQIQTFLDEEDPFTIPPIFDEFFRFLIPEEDERPYFFRWIWECIFDRAETILVLNGKKGAGKNLFANLMKNIVGADNYTEAQKGFLRSNFNSVLKGKRVLVMDEVTAKTDQDIDTLKRYANRYQTLEKKFQDVSRLEEIHASLMMLNNRATDLKLSSDDRRFLLVNLTQVPLNKRWSPEKIYDFIEATNNEINIRNFTFWIHKNFSDVSISNFDFVRSKKFQQVAISGLTDFESFLLDLFVLNPEGLWDRQELSIEYQSYLCNSNVKIPKSKKIQDFLDEFMLCGKPIGTCMKPNNKFSIRSLVTKEHAAEICEIENYTAPTDKKLIRVDEESQDYYESILPQNNTEVPDDPFSSIVDQSERLSEDVVFHDFEDDEDELVFE